MTTFGRTLGLAASAGRMWIVAVALGTATLACGIGLIATAAWLIGSAALHPSVAALGVATVGVRFFGLARGVFRYLERYVTHSVTFTLLAQLRVWFYAAIESHAPTTLAGYRSGDLLRRIVADIETLQNVFVGVIAPPLMALLVGSALAFGLGMVAGVFGLIIFAAYLMIGAALPMLAYVLGRRVGTEIVATQNELAVLTIDAVQGMADMLAFGAADAHAARITATSAILARLQARQAWIKGLHSALTVGLTNLTLVAMFVAALPMVAAGRLSGVTLTVLALTTLAGFEAVAGLPSAFQSLGGSLAAARRLFHLADSPRSLTDTARMSPVATDSSLHVRGLAVRYATDSGYALRNLSFDLLQGQTLAITGASGVGKSTLVKVLTRMVEYEAGDIRLGGNDLRAYRGDDVRKLVAVVEQRSHLFNTTIADNLRLARPDATQAEIEAAARQAHIHDFIIGLPEGYLTHVGEMGLRLSGGEQQRLAIARAILQDAPILILDEPTANLDAANEVLVYAALADASRNRTTIIITHGSAGVAFADVHLRLTLAGTEGISWKR